MGTATGLDPTGKPAVKVFTAQAGVAGIPTKLDGERVEVVVTGQFFAVAPPAGKGKPPENNEPTLSPRVDGPSPCPSASRSETNSHAPPEQSGARCLMPPRPTH